MGYAVTCEVWSQGQESGGSIRTALTPMVYHALPLPQKWVAELPLMRDTFFVLGASGWRLPKVNETCCARPSLAKLLRDGGWEVGAAAGAAVDRHATVALFTGSWSAELTSLYCILGGCWDPNPPALSLLNLQWRHPARMCSTLASMPRRWRLRWWRAGASSQQTTSKWVGCWDSQPLRYSGRLSVAWSCPFESAAPLATAAPGFVVQQRQAGEVGAFWPPSHPCTPSAVPSRGLQCFLPPPPPCRTPRRWCGSHCGRRPWGWTWWRRRRPAPPQPCCQRCWSWGVSRAWGESGVGGCQGGNLTAVEGRALHVSHQAASL